MATGQELQQAYDLIRSGHRHHAANMLTALLVADPQNADAWWLLALAAPSAEIVRRALCRLLELRPDDMRARQLLDSLGVRQLRAEGRAAALQRQQAALAAASNGLEPRQPRLRRRGGGHVSILRQRRSTGFFVALTMALVFGVAGCALLAVALASGLQLVERAAAGFQPALVAPALEASEQPDLGDINSLGNTGYTQFRGGTLRSAADRHAYTFSGAAGDLVSIEVATPNSTLDPAFAVYAPDGRLIVVGAASRGEADARLTFTLPAGGVYTIVITSQGSSGSYQLALRH